MPFDGKGEWYAYDTICVVDHRVSWFVTDDRQIFFELYISFVHFHKFRGSVFFLLAEGSKGDFGGGKCFVGERSSDFVEIVGTDGDEGAPTANVLVKFLLELHQAAVTIGVEFNVAEDSTDNKLTDMFGLG